VHALQQRAHRGGLHVGAFLLAEWVPRQDLLTGLRGRPNKINQKSFREKKTVSSRWKDQIWVGNHDKKREKEVFNVIRTPTWGGDSSASIMRSSSGLPSCPKSLYTTFLPGITSFSISWDSFMRGTLLISTSLKTHPKAGCVEG
jgi:hypothetical protein